MVRLLPPSACWCVQLEGPEEVGRIFEVLAHCEYFVDQVLHANEVLLPQGLLNDRVGGQRGTPMVNLRKASLVNQVPNALLIRISPGNVRLTNSEHVDCGLVQLDKNAVVDLPQSEQLESLANLRMDLVDTSNTDDKGEFGLSWDIEVTLISGLSEHSDLIPFLLSVFLDVLFRSLEDLHPLVPIITSILGSSLQQDGL